MGVKALNLAGGEKEYKKIEVLDMFLHSVVFSTWGSCCHLQFQDFQAAHSQDSGGGFFQKSRAVKVAGNGSSTEHFVGFRYSMI